MNPIRLTLATTAALAAFSAAAADGTPAIDPLQLQTQVSEQVRFAARDGATQQGVQSEQQLRIQEQQRLRLRQERSGAEATAVRHSHYGQGFESRAGTGFNRPASGGGRR